MHWATIGTAHQCGHATVIELNRVERRPQPSLHESRIAAQPILQVFQSVQTPVHAAALEGHRKRINAGRQIAGRHCVGPKRADRWLLEVRRRRRQSPIVCQVTASGLRILFDEVRRLQSAFEDVGDELLQLGFGEFRSARRLARYAVGKAVLQGHERPASVVSQK